MLKRTLLAAVAGSAMMGGSAVMAEDLTIALASEPSAMDPHFHNLGPNNAITRHIYEPLILQDEN